MISLNWLQEAARYIGVKEIPGPQDNPLIVKWGKEAGIEWWNNDDDAWCAVFVNGIMVATGHKSTKSALAKSFLKWGYKLDKPVPGAVVIFDRPPEPWMGHVGIVETVNSNSTVTIINGNVSNMVKRSTFTIASIVPNGIRWPDDAPLPDGLSSSSISTPPKYELGDRELSYDPNNAIMRGPDVREWQKMLKEFGYNITVDGIYGAGTRDATISRQNHAGIREDGIVGRATLTATREDLAERRSKKKKKSDQATGAGVGVGVGGAAGAGGVIVAVDQATDSIGKIQDVIPSDIGVAALVTFLIVIGGFLLYYFVIRPRMNKEPEPEENRRIERSEERFENVEEVLEWRDMRAG